MVVECFVLVVALLSPVEGAGVKLKLVCSAPLELGFLYDMCFVKFAEVVIFDKNPGL